MTVCAVSAAIRSVVVLPRQEPCTLRSRSAVRVRPSADTSTVPTSSVYLSVLFPTVIQYAPPPAPAPSSATTSAHPTHRPRPLSAHRAIPPASPSSQHPQV